MWVDLDQLCAPVWPRPDPRSRSRSQSFWTSENCRKLHFSRPISSTILAWSSKLIVDHDSTGPILQLVGARFSNFILRKLSREFKLRGTSILHEFQMTIFPYSRRLLSHGLARVLMSAWPDSGSRSRSRSLTFWISENCTFLRLTSSLFWRGAHNWWVITIVRDLVYSFSKPDFWISPQLPVTWLQSSRNVNITRIHCVLYSCPVLCTPRISFLLRELC